MCTQWPGILAQCIAPIPVPANNGDADQHPTSACARRGKFLHRVITWFPSNIPIIGLTIANGVINILRTKTDTSSSAVAWPFLPLMSAIGFELMGNNAARKIITFNESLEKIKLPLQRISLFKEINCLNSILDPLPTLHVEAWEQQIGSTLQDVEEVYSEISTDQSIQSYISSSRGWMSCHGMPITSIFSFGWGIGSAAGFCASSFIIEDNDANATALRVMSTVNTVLICCSIAQTVYRNYLANRLSKRFESSFENLGRAKGLLEFQSTELKTRQSRQEAELTIQEAELKKRQYFGELKIQETVEMPGEFTMDIVG